MIQRGERDYLVRYPAVADCKQSKSKMIQFETVFLQFILQFNHWSFHTTYVLHGDLIHIQRAQSLNSVSNIFPFLEST